MHDGAHDLDETRLLRSGGVAGVRPLGEEKRRQTRARDRRRGVEDAGAEPRRVDVAPGGVAIATAHVADLLPQRAARGRRDAAAVIQPHRAQQQRDVDRRSEQRPILDHPIRRCGDDGLQQRARANAAARDQREPLMRRVELRDGVIQQRETARMRLEQPRNECGGIAGLRGGEIPPDCVRAGRTRRHDRPVADSNAAAERRGQAGVTLERVEHFLVRRDPRQRGIVHRVEAVVQKRRVAMGEDAQRQPLVGDAGIAQQSR